MKVIVAGSRNIENKAEVARAIESTKLKITEVVIGNARGVDAIAENYANIIHANIKVFPAETEKYGKPAGHIRNEQMTKYADALVAIWDGQSTGTRDMIRAMNKEGKPVYLYLVKTEKEQYHDRL